MAPHSSTLAWKIPWTEDPGRLQSMGLLRVGHDRATSLSLSCIGERNGNPLQCSCLENPRDREAWWAAIYGVTQSWTRLKRLSSSSPCFVGFPGGSVVKNLPGNTGDSEGMTLIPGSGRFPGGGNGNPLQYSHLGNPMNRGAPGRLYIVHRVAKRHTQVSMSMHALVLYFATRTHSFFSNKNKMSPKLLSNWQTPEAQNTSIHIVSSWSVNIPQQPRPPQRALALSQIQ